MKTVDFKDLNEDLYAELKRVLEERMGFIQGEDYSEDYNCKFDHAITEAAMELVFGNADCWTEYNRLVDEANERDELRNQVPS